jgi:hypothetical protein
MLGAVETFCIHEPIETLYKHFEAPISINCSNISFGAPPDAA